jgi:hypothetical protein
MPKNHHRARVRGLVAATLSFGAVITLSNSSLVNGQTDVALSPIEILVEKEAIREQLAQYDLLLAGDGVRRDGLAWATRLFTQDATFQVFTPDGRMFLNPRNRDEIAQLVGRRPVTTNQQRPSPPPGPARVTRHFPINTAFDELTRTTARTRTSTLVISVPRIADPAIAPVITLVTYHDTWRKEADGVWRKSSTILRNANCATAHC